MRGRSFRGGWDKLRLVSVRRWLEYLLLHSIAFSDGSYLGYDA